MESHYFLEFTVCCHLILISLICYHKVLAPTVAVTCLLTVLTQNSILYVFDNQVFEDQVSSFKTFKEYPAFEGTILR